MKARPSKPSEPVIKIKLLFLVYAVTKTHIGMGLGAVVGHRPIVEVCLQGGYGALSL